MFNRQYPSNGAFERLVRSVDRLEENNLRRVDLHKGMINSQVGLTAPEIDFLFDLLAGHSQELTIDHWLAKIYDDVHNPLQLIREVIQSLDLNIDDIMF
jgi:hypothetical protein